MWRQAIFEPVNYFPEGGLQEMSESTLWWIIAGFFISLELLTRSAYLMILAAGAAVAAMAAMVDVPQTAQLLLAGLIGGGGVFLWHRQLLKRGPLDTEGYNTTGLGDLDVGEEVSVKGWAPDGTAQVCYRGGEWMARHYGPLLPRSGRHRILAVETTCLVLEPLQA
jgi:membrane protein implicated in regulation of membrane protease activity